MIQVHSHQQPYGRNQRLSVDGFHHNNNNKTNVVCISRRNRTLSVGSTLLLLIFLLSILQLELVHTFTVSNVPSLLLPPPSHTFHLQQQATIKTVLGLQSSRWDEDTNNNNDNNNEITSNNTVATTTSTTSITTSSTGSNIDIELEQQINQGLQRAKEVLQKSKAKLAAMERNNNGGTDNNNNEEVVVTNNVPFFATRLPISTTTSVAGGVAMAMTTTIVSEDTIRTTTTTPTKITDRNMKVKSRNSDTGLVMADGERMAEISEYEPWEYRSIYELFPNDGDDNDDDANIPGSSQSQSPPPRRVEIQTDVMASIQNLRKVLQTEDYRKIFDPRNRFIGEDN